MVHIFARTDITRFSLDIEFLDTLYIFYCPPWRKQWYHSSQYKMKLLLYFPETPLCNKSLRIVGTLENWKLNNNNLWYNPSEFQFGFLTIQYSVRTLEQMRFSISYSISILREQGRCYGRYEKIFSAWFGQQDQYFNVGFWYGVE